jgi:hypothetical protein
MGEIWRAKNKKLKKKKMKKKAIVVLSLITVCWSWFFICNHVSAEGLIYISQVQITNGSGKTTEDFVELYNPGDAEFNLKGHRLVKRSANGTTDTLIKSWTSDTLVPSHGYYLWANSSYGAISVSPDATTTGTISDDNGIAIREGASDTGTIIDSVAWGNTNNTFLNISSENPGAGQSLLRSDFSSATGTFLIGASNPRNVASGGILPDPDPNPTGGGNPTPTTTPASTPPPTASGSQLIVPIKSDMVKISEILPNPSGDDSGQEKIELSNIGSETVSLNGWWFGDGVSAVPKSNAYQITDQSIAPGEFKVFTIPSKYFTLNNTGGETVNLYFADKTVADSVAYSEDAKENSSYQKFQDGWVWSAPTFGKGNFGSIKNSSGTSSVHINEFMANPFGSNEGNQWVELVNDSSETVNIKGYILDFGTGSTVSKNTYVFNEKAILPPLGFYVAYLPEDSVILPTATGTEQLRLFDPTGALVESFPSGNAPEGLSYSKTTAGMWEYKFSTPGKDNSFVPPDYRVIISEILPNPSPEEEEFIELRNVGDSNAQLKGMKLYIGTKIKTLDEFVLASGSFFTLYFDDLPAHLRNSGETIRLVDSYDREMSSITYLSAPKGQSYAYGETLAAYEWTELLTPDSTNQLVLAAATTVSSSRAVTAKPVSKKISSSELVSSKTNGEIQSANSELLKSVDELKQKVSELQETIETMANNIVTAPEAQASSKNGDEKPVHSWNFFGIGLIAFFGLVSILIWKNPFKSVQ